MLVPQDHAKQAGVTNYFGANKQLVVQLRFCKIAR